MQSLASVEVGVDVGADFIGTDIFVGGMRAGAVAVAVCIQAVAHHPSRHHIGGSALAARYSRCGYQRFLQLECIVIQRVCVHSRMFFS